MNQVFSRWPSLAPPSVGNGQEGEGGLPAWMLAPPRNRWPSLAGDITAACLLILVPAILVGLAGFGIALEFYRGVAVLGLFAVLAAWFAGAQIVQLRSRMRSSETQFSAIFERAGISIWREDWSAAGEAVAALRRSGVTDIEGYFAERPAELRVICGKVLIKDVNTFTLEEAGAPDKSAFLGPLDRLLPPTDQTFVQWLVAFGRGDRYFRSEAHITRVDGEQSETLFTAMLPRDLAGFSDIVVTSVDITAFKKALARLAATEAELARASRIVTVGAFSASIAHEVNTPLAAISANAQAALRWLKRETPNIEEAIAALTDIASEATRARDVVTRTRSFLGQAPVEIVQVNVIHAARDAILFAEREVRTSGAIIHLMTEPAVPLVPGDLVQIQQVFVNLFVNAAQAVAFSAGRRDITVAIRRRDAVVWVSVTDSGPGIEPAQRARIFDPFHSTKPGGMGMGLAICRNCIDAHGGDIWVDEAPQGGAAFHFTLPVSRHDQA